MSDLPKATGVKQFDLSALDRNWIKVSLKLQSASLQRTVAKEPEGSQVREIRLKEIAFLSDLVNRLGG